MTQRRSLPKTTTNRVEPVAGCHHRRFGSQDGYSSGRAPQATSHDRARNRRGHRASPRRTEQRRGCHHAGGPAARVGGSAQPPRFPRPGAGRPTAAHDHGARVRGPCFGEQTGNPGQRAAARSATALGAARGTSGVRVPPRRRRHRPPVCRCRASRCSHVRRTSRRPRPRACHPVRHLRPRLPGGSPTRRPHSRRQPGPRRRPPANTAGCSHLTPRSPKKRPVPWPGFPNRPHPVQPSRRPRAFPLSAPRPCRRRRSATTCPDCPACRCR